MADWHIIHGDAATELRAMEPGSVQCCVTSPPYWGLRDYGVAGQLGLEPTPEQYVEALVGVFREVRRVLSDDGTLWLNLGDSYAASRTYQVTDRKWRDVGNTKGSTVPPGLKPKDLVGIPWRIAFALQADGWYLRSDIIWAKPNPMPESVTDRPTKAHEYVFLLSKSRSYYYDADAMREPHTTPGSERNSGRWEPGRPRPKHGDDPRMRTRPGSRPPDYFGHPDGRNARTVWSIHTEPFPGAHFAVMPKALAERCILAGSRKGDAVLDPFAGSGTVGVVCRKHERCFVGIELSEEYARMARGRLGEDQSADTPLFAGDAA